MGYSKYSKEEIELAVNESFTWADVCRKLDIKPSTGSQTHLKHRAVNFEIDYSHFIGKSWSKGKTLPPRRSLEDYFSGSPIKSHSLKLRLIREKIKEHRCEICGGTEWRGQLIPIELDHINGDNTDNSLENLRILCPNCHAQTETYCAKNIYSAVAQRQEALRLERK